jgi:hypothetical protein
MKRALIILALVAGAAPAVYAQGTNKASAKTADDPEASSIGTGSASRIVLEAGDANSKATARLAGDFGGEGDIDGRYALTVNAPFDSNKADHVDVGSLSGLSAGTSATLEFGVRRWASPTDEEIDAMMPVCEEHLPKLIPGYSWEDLTTVVAIACDDHAFDLEQLNKLIKGINEVRETCAKCVAIEAADPPICLMLRDARQQSCGSKSPPDNLAVCAVLEKNLREECAVCKDVKSGEGTACGVLARHRKPAALIEDKQQREALLAKARAAARPVAAKLLRPLSMFTVGLTANTQQFTYLLADNLDEVHKNDKEGVGITLAATHVLRRSAWTLGYSHEESYKGTDKLQLCRPLGATGASTCTAASLGAPKKQKAEIAFLQNRVAFADGRFALAPRVEFDFKKSQWAARVPFYFIASKSHELTGGVAVGYTEVDDEGLGATVFISKAFTFY